MNWELSARRIRSRDDSMCQEGGSPEHRRRSLRAYLASSNSISNTRPALPSSIGRAHRAVSQIRRDDQSPLASKAHRLKSLIPSANHVTGAKPEGERLAAERRIELLAFEVWPVRIVQPARIVDGHLRPAAHLWSAARDEIAIGEC
jgi:hypothetical protein